MRDFLTDIKIVGVTLASRDADLLDYAIPNMLKWCDWIMIMMDNESKEVYDKVREYEEQYRGKKRGEIDRIIVRRSSYHLSLYDEVNNKFSARWKALRGAVRDDALAALRRNLEFGNPNYNKIDILLWPDSDEVFTDYLPTLLEEFWKSNYKGIRFRTVEVVYNMHTIKSWGKAPHMQAMKYTRDLCAFPKKFFCMYSPISMDETMVSDNCLVHLAYLTQKHRDFKKDNNWRSFDFNNNRKELGSALWTLDKDVTELTPDEIKEVLRRPPDSDFNNYNGIKL